MFQDLATAEPDKSTSPVTINAHQSDLACIAINHDGTQVATASRKVHVTCFVSGKFSVWTIYNVS